MTDVCIAPVTGGQLLADLLNHLDCQAANIGEAGYQALTQSNATGGPLLVVLLSLFLAIYGVRLMFGERLAPSELAITGLKLAFVLALATSWSSFRPTFYDLTLRAPAELFGTIGAASSLPGSDGGLVARLQGGDDAMAALTVAGTGKLDRVNPDDVDSAIRGQIPVSDGFAFGLGRSIFVAAIVSGFGAVRLLSGLFLALAPLFAGALLFQATKPWFFGWLRLLIACALASLALSIVLAVELAVLEPWLASTLDARAQALSTPSAAYELMAMALAFAAISAGSIWGSFKIGFANVGALTPKLASYVPPNEQRNLDNAQSDWRPSQAIVPVILAEGQLAPAQTLAQGLLPVSVGDEQDRSQRRGDPGRMPVLSNRDEPEPRFVPLGQSYSRTSLRTSQITASRDQRQ